LVKAALPLLIFGVSAAFSEQAHAQTYTIPPAINAFCTSTYFGVSNDVVEWVTYEDFAGNLNVVMYAPWFSSSWDWRYQIPAGNFAPGSQLVGYMDKSSTAHLFFLHQNGSVFDVEEVYGLYIGEGAYGYQTNDLTTDTGSSYRPDGYEENYSTKTGNISGVSQTYEYSTGLTGFWDGSIEHVFYGSENGGNLAELYNNGSWWVHSIATNPFTAGTEQHIASLWDGSISHVYYHTGSAGDLGETYYSGTWYSHDLSRGATAPAAASPLFATGGDQDGDPLQYVWGATSTAGDLSLWYNSGSWNEFTYTGKTGLTTSSTVTGYSAPLNETIFSEYFWVEPSNGHIWYGGYGEQDITGGSAPALPSYSGGSLSPLSGCFDGTNLHVFYIGNDSNVWEIYTVLGQYGQPGTWYGHAITSAANAVQ
jgi:hypothetical protein